MHAGAEILRAAAARGTDLTASELDAALRDPAILRFLGKLQHADEWARSIEVIRCCLSCRHRVDRQWLLSAGVVRNP